MKFQIGDYVGYDDIKGVITNRTRSSGQDYGKGFWTIRRDDGYHGGDDNGGWVCREEGMTLISRPNPKTQSFFD